MIELVFTGMCKGCEVGDLSLEPAYYDSYGETRVLQWAVVCSHQQACARAHEDYVSMQQTCYKLQKALAEAAPHNNPEDSIREVNV